MTDTLVSEGLNQRARPQNGVLRRTLSNCVPHQEARSRMAMGMFVNLFSFSPTLAITTTDLKRIYPLFGFGRAHVLRSLDTFAAVHRISCELSRSHGVLEYAHRARHIDANTYARWRCTAGRDSLPLHAALCAVAAGANPWFASSPSYHAPALVAPRRAFHLARPHYCLPVSSARQRIWMVCSGRRNPSLSPESALSVVRPSAFRWRALPRDLCASSSAAF